MGMNLAGRSLPTGPAITPHASSGWSLRAWSMIFAWRSREIVSMIGEITRWALPVQRADQRLLHGAQPAVDLERGDLRVVGGERGELFLEVLGHLEPHPEHQPHVVQRPHPVPGLVTREPDPAAGGRQRVEQGLREVLLGLAQRRLRVLAELARRLGIVLVGVGQQPGEHRVVRGGRRFRGFGRFDGLCQQPVQVVGGAAWRFLAAGFAGPAGFAKQVKHRDHERAQQRRLAWRQPDADAAVPGAPEHLHLLSLRVVGGLATSGPGGPWPIGRNRAAPRRCAAWTPACRRRPRPCPCDERRASASPLSAGDTRRRARTRKSRRTSGSPDRSRRWSSTACPAPFHPLTTADLAQRVPRSLLHLLVRSLPPVTTPANSESDGSSADGPAGTALLTDHYELTMLQAALHSGAAHRRTVFEVFARQLPHGRRYGVVAGTGRRLDALERFRFGPQELAFLRDSGIVDETTLRYLSSYRFGGNIWGYAEGDVYFPGSPIIVVEGTFAESVLLETLVLSIMNHDS